MSHLESLLQVLNIVAQCYEVVMTYFQGCFKALKCMFNVAMQL